MTYGLLGNYCYCTERVFTSCLCLLVSLNARLSAVYIRQVSTHVWWEKCVRQVEVNCLHVGSNVRRWVINQMANSVWVDKLRRYSCHLFFLVQTSFLCLFLEVLYVVNIVCAYWWQRVRELSLIINPPAIISFQVRFDPSFGCWWYWLVWVIDYSRKHTKQCSWQHDSTLLARQEHTAACQMVIYGWLFY